MCHVSCAALLKTWKSIREILTTIKKDAAVWWHGYDSTIFVSNTASRLFCGSHSASHILVYNIYPLRFAKVFQNFQTVMISILKPQSLRNPIYF